MAYQTVFKRYELKYLLTERQKKCVMEAMEPCMTPDAYGRTTIRNIYFDTADYRLARRSIEKPVYKEKLRIRSYEKASGASPVFVELKKKYKGVVYKRRISMPEREAMEWTTGETDRKEDSQISREIGYFLRFYGNLRPAGFLTYQREAFLGKEQKDFRITFDRLVLFRQEDISLESDVYGILTGQRKCGNRCGRGGSFQPCPVPVRTRYGQGNLFSVSGHGDRTCHRNGISGICRTVYRRHVRGLPALLPWKTGAGETG